MFWISKIVGALVLPPNGPIVVALAGLLLARSRPRLGARLALLGVGSLVVLSVPIVAGWLSVTVADGHPLPPDAPVNADAIVVLGCGVRNDAPEYGGDTLSSMSLERARYAAYLARRHHLPVAVAGGTVFRGRPEADVIADAIEQEYGIPVRWRERASRNTHENATGLRDLLQKDGVRRIVVVTHGIDARRARRELDAVGFAVTLAPTVMPTANVDSVWDFVPSIAGLRGSYLALYEMLGNLKTSVQSWL